MTNLVRAALGVLLLTAATCPAAETAQWGVDSGRNNAPPATGLPVQWNVGEFDDRGTWQGSDDRQIRWVARLGSETYGTPIVAGGKVYCATNNAAGYLPRLDKKVDAGVLVCLSAADGAFCWQHSVSKHPAGRYVDWPQQGICSSPLVEGQRLYLVTNRGEVVCLDTEGHADGENDGAVQDEPAGAGESDVVWRFDMMRSLGSVQRYMASCSVTAVGPLLLVATGNGTDAEENVSSPRAPSFIALEKATGKLVWADASPGENILEGQWASPAVAPASDGPQALFAGGDGWLYAFAADRGHQGRPTLLWKFDGNPKDALWEGSGGAGRRNHFVATPVVVGERVFIGTGQDPEAGEGEGDLWCLQTGKRGDVSPQLVVDRDGRPAGRGRRIACDAAAGEQVRPNPNSAAVWHYTGVDADGDGKRGFAETMHRTIAAPVVAGGMLVVADFAGLVHCLDAANGKPHWTEDLMSAVWGGPLAADGKVYVATEDGDVCVFELATRKRLLAKNAMQSAIFSTPTATGGTLYIAARHYLFAIAAAATGRPAPTGAAP